MQAIFKASLIGYMMRSICMLCGLCIPFIAYPQSPIVLSTSAQSFVFELIPTSSMTQHLTPDTTAKLATPAQHAERGLPYPLWLADASFVVKTRARQRQTIRVEAKRGNPALTTDVLLALNTRGIRNFESQTLVFDSIDKMANAPMPPQSEATQPDLRSGFSDSLKSSPPLTFALVQPEAQPPHTGLTAKSVPSTVEPEGHTNSAPVQPKSVPRQTRSVRTAKSAPPLTSPEKVEPTTPVPIPTASAAIASAPAVVTASSAPVSTNQITPARPPAKTIPPESSWLDDWPLLAGAFALIGLLGGWLWLRRRRTKAKHSDFTMTAQSTEQATNTVFGLTAEEAESMHQKWLSQQILQKSNT